MEDPKRVEAILPLKREKISDKVVQVIQNYIVRNNLRRGDRLPSERELSETLNVGTRSIREALRNLEARGVVRIEQGKGAFVEEKYRDDFVRFLAESLELTLTRDQNLLVELVYVRKLIETSVIAEMAAVHDPGVIARLEEVLAALLAAKNAGDQDEYNRIDVMFHKTMIEATGNRILIAIYDRMTNLLLESFTKTGYAHGSPERSFREHAEMVEDLRAGDPDRARTVMDEHLAHTMKTLRSYLSSSDVQTDDNNNIGST